MNEADKDTTARHHALWKAFRQRPEVSPWTGRLELPPGVTAMLGFVIPVEGDAIVRALGDALTRVGASGCLLPFTPDYWHITIVPPALLTDGERPASGEGSPLLPTSFAATVFDEATAAVAAQPPFDVSVRGLNAFRDVLVAVPYDGGRGDELGRVIRAAEPRLPQRYHAGHDPLPHISVARYSSSERLQPLTSLIHAERDTAFGSFHVERLEMFLLPVHDGVPGSVQKRTIPLRQR